MHLKSFKCYLTIVFVVVLCVLIFGKLNHAVCVDENTEDQTCDAHTDRPASNVERLNVESSSPEEINVIITFTNVKNNINLQSKFGTTVSSLFKHSSVRIALFIIGDGESQNIAKNILEEHVNDNTKYRVREIFDYFV